MISYAKSATARPGDRLNGFKNCKTQLFNSWGVGKFAYFQKKWSVPLQCCFMESCFVFHRGRKRHGVMARQEGFHFGVNYAFKPTITLHCITKNKYAEHITDSMKTIKQG